MEPTEDPKPTIDYFGFRLWSKIFLVVAIFLTATGVIVVFSDSRPFGSSDFLFYVSRGIALICTGISCGVVSLVLVLFAILDQSEK